MAQRLTTFSKLLITMLIVGVVVFAGKYFLDNTEAGQDLMNKDGKKETDTTSENTAVDSDDVIKIGVVTWGGYAGGQYFNEGFKPNAASRFKKEYGLDVEFKVLDDFDASRSAFKNDDVNLLWATIDAFPTEVNALKDFNPVIVFQADWSRGGDAIVVRRGISRVSDLKGKKIAVAELTPSHSFLLWLLEAGGFSPSDVEIVPQSSAIDAAEVFKAKKVDAAVVWSPDDVACLRAVPGSRVLESTRSASHIIADAFMAKRSYVEKNKDKLQKLYEGWMRGAAEINTSEQAKKRAAQILSENFAGFTPEDTYNAINNVRLVTHGDNKNFFGLNTSYKGVTGNSLYTRMADSYKSLNFIEGNVPNWRLIAYPDIVMSTTLTGEEQFAEMAKTFKDVTTSDKKKEAIATKQVSISFRTGEFKLDENAKYIIDKEFVEIAKAFSNSRIRIEGNTDNVGNRASNVKLSEKRAQSVANYLIETYEMPKNRFIIVGNGPDKAVANNNTDAGRSKNRRTDFELVPD